MLRRAFLQTSLAAIGATACGSFARAAAPGESEIRLGQDGFRYRFNRYWGQLDRRVTPVENCHAITENRAGEIVLLNTDVRNNLITYTKAGGLVSKREHRFPAAHALEFVPDARGDELLWITDTAIPAVSLCAPDGRELRRMSREAVASAYSDGEKYSPTNVAVMPNGDFFVSDGYGSHRILHFDPDWKLAGVFGGAGPAPENLNQPHAIWLDRRRGASELLVCDRMNEALKWFGPDGHLRRVVPLPGARPSNIAPMAGDHLLVTCLNGMLLVLDSADQVVSAIGGEPPLYQGGVLQPLVAFNNAFNHPHDACVDAAGDIYVAQWNSNRTYPVKLERL